MAESILVVEAWDEVNEVWKPVGKPFYGEEEDTKSEAEALKKEWTDSGWPEKDIRISKSVFREFNKRYRED